MNFQIAPSILSGNLGYIADLVQELDESGADWIHFDVMDGQFVPPITFGADVIASIPKPKNAKFEAHLMTLTPEKHFDMFSKAGCERIIFHVEATFHAHRLIGSLKDIGVLAGIAINPATPVCSIESVLDDLDLILVMSVNPGAGGQPFLGNSISKIQRIRELSSTVNIEVDGGIDPKTIRLAAEAGANVFVSGSFVTMAPTIREGLSSLGEALQC